MFNALIIDDEKHVRQTIAALGNWAENDINTPFQATDGESALRLMEEYPINLVLVDIKMPIMDGMQFIELASKRYPKCKYVVVSGFSDFEYAKKAIQFQVMDYLLKPVSEDELNCCLSKTVKELDEEYQIMSESPLLDLINQLCTNTAEGFQCSIAAVRIADSSIYSWDSSAVLHLKSYLNASASADVNFITITEKPYLLLLGISCRNHSQAIPVHKRIMHAVTQAITHMYQQTHILTLTGIGSVSSPSVAELKLSYQTAVRLVNRMNLFTSSPIIANDQSGINDWKPHSISFKKDVLKRAMDKGDITYFRNLVELYFESLKSKGMITSEVLSHNSVELLLMMQEFAQEKCTERYDQIIPSLNEVEQLEIHNINGVVEYFCSLFSQLCHLTDPSQQMTIKFILQEIKAYIEEQYACDITLTFFAEKYHLTKEYLSKQFKEEYGYGIYEYVLAFRMQKASEYLLSSNLKVQEISNHVGYPDTNYFSKAFKTFYGLSPKEYRQNKKKL